MYILYDPKDAPDEDEDAGHIEDVYVAPPRELVDVDADGGVCVGYVCGGRGASSVGLRIGVALPEAEEAEESQPAEPAKAEVFLHGFIVDETAVEGCGDGDEKAEERELREEANNDDDFTKADRDRRFSGC